MAAAEITDDDLGAAMDAFLAASVHEQMWPVILRSTLRPGGLVARAVVAALDEATARVIADCSHGDIRMGEWPAPSCPFCQPKASSVAAVAAEWREGKR